METLLPPRLEASERIQALCDIAQDALYLLPPQVEYHNVEHTQSVLARSMYYAAQANLPQHEKYVLALAAAFHDVGFLQGPEQHELRSAQHAARILSDYHVCPEMIQEVQHAILATQMPQRPVTLLEQILCDADLDNLGTEEFMERGARLRRELAHYSGVLIPPQDWCEKSLKLLKEHTYWTSYAREERDAQKQRNVAGLERMMTYFVGGEAL